MAFRRGWRRILILAVSCYWIAAAIGTLNHYGVRHLEMLKLFLGDEWWNLDLKSPALAGTMKTIDEQVRTYVLMHLAGWVMAFVALAVVYAIVRWVVLGFVPSKRQ